MTQREFIDRCNAILAEHVARVKARLLVVAAELVGDSVPAQAAVPSPATTAAPQRRRRRVVTKTVAPKGLRAEEQPTTVEVERPVDSSTSPTFHARAGADVDDPPAIDAAPARPLTAHERSVQRRALIAQERHPNPPRVIPSPPPTPLSSWTVTDGRVERQGA